MSTITAHQHCGHCGTRFADQESWPRTCQGCKNLTFRNPIPVAVVILPVDDGILVVRRGIEPRQGLLTLPGGFVDWGRRAESWQEGGARETLEEASVGIDPNLLTLFRAISTPDNTRILMFAVAAPMREADLPPFKSNPEASERIIIRGPEELAFPIHTQVVADYFREQRKGRA